MPARFGWEISRIGGVLVVSILVLAAFAYGYEAEEVHGGGSISGVVKYQGAPPPPVRIAVTKDRDVCGTAPVFDQSLIVGPNRGIANAVVALTDAGKGEAAKPQSAVAFDQKNCQYIPHVAVFPAGSTVLILNSDGILHNIHTQSTINPVIDLAQPGFKRQIRVTIAKPEAIKVTCDAHNWMEGWWYVTANPYYAITNSDGHYAIANVPPGTYSLQVWQERLGTQTQRVQVRPGAETVIDFTLKGGKSLH